MKRYLIFFSYIGRQFKGLQRQVPSYLEPDFCTVQGCIETALIKLFTPRNKVTLHTSSRTDTGVHAFRSSAHIDLDLEPKYKIEESVIDIPYQLNRFFLKKNVDINIQSAQVVPNEFTARGNVVRRTYIYRIGVLKNEFKETGTNFFPISELGRTLILRPNEFDVKKALDILPLFNGIRDFKSFMSATKDEKPTIQAMNVDILPATSLFGELDFYNQYFDYWYIACSSRSFLYREVRRIVSVIIAVAIGRMCSDDVKFLFSKPAIDSWHPAANVVPPFGLYLKNVEYNEEDLIVNEMDSNVTLKQ